MNHRKHRGIFNFTPDQVIFQLYMTSEIERTLYTHVILFLPSFQAHFDHHAAATIAKLNHVSNIDRQVDAAALYRKTPLHKKITVGQYVKVRKKRHTFRQQNAVFYSIWSDKSFKVLLLY